MAGTSGVCLWDSRWQTVGQPSVWSSVVTDVCFCLIGVYFGDCIVIDRQTDRQIDRQIDR
jgi:hypothetical protein